MITHSAKETEQQKEQWGGGFRWQGSGRCWTKYKIWKREGIGNIGGRSSYNRELALLCQPCKKILTISPLFHYKPPPPPPPPPFSSPFLVKICLALYLQQPLFDSLHHMVKTRFYTNWSIWMQLEKCWNAVKLWGWKILKMGG